MGIRLTDRERRYIALLERETGAAAKDCIVDEEGDRVLFVVASGEMARAIGPDGHAVKQVTARIGRDVELIEAADTPAAFVASALEPAVVYDVEIAERDGERIARAEVDEADMGIAIGTDGRNIAAARRLAKRHFDIDDIELV